MFNPRRRYEQFPIHVAARHQRHSHAPRIVRRDAERLLQFLFRGVARRQSHGNQTTDPCEIVGFPDACLGSRTVLECRMSGVDPGIKNGLRIRFAGLPLTSGQVTCQTKPTPRSAPGFFL